MTWVAAAVLLSKKGTLRWLIHLGGPGLILLGVADNSLVPMPGSTDVITIVLAAHRGQPWFYYAIMATLGAVLGGYFTYRMARTGGEATLEKRLSPQKIKKIYAIFDRWGFASIAIPAFLPPPVPIVPVLLAAGAMQYPTKKFLSALAVGRGARFTIIAFLGAHYGRNIVKFFSQYYQPVLIALIASSLVGATYGLLKYIRWKKNSPPKTPRPRTRTHERAA